MDKIRPKEVMECEFCGKQFFSKFRAFQKYCSHECRYEMQKVRERNMHSTFTCLKCGKVFVAGYNSTRSLCASCKEEAMSGRKKSGKEERKKRDYSGLMRAVKESGLSYGQYTSGTGRVEDAYTSITKQEGWDGGWVMLGEEQPAPKATVKVNVAKLPKMPIPYRAYTPKEEPVEVSPLLSSDNYHRLMGTNKKGVPYTPEDDEVILEMRNAGETYTSIALMIGRAPTSVMKRYRKLTGEPA